MAINYSKQFNRKVTPQSEPIPASNQIPNSAGGHVWLADDWTRLERFLILGSEDGTYYVRQRDLLRDNHDAVLRCIAADGGRVVCRAVAVSEGGRAPKNDPAIFVLALVAAHGDASTRDLALRNLGRVCRTGTHLFHFAEYVNALRGWGRGLRKAVANWYTDRGAEDLAYQVVKYQQRDGWSHADLLRLAHPKAANGAHDAVFRWACGGRRGLGKRRVNRIVRPAIRGKVRARRRTTKYDAVADSLPPLIHAFEEAKRATSRDEIVRLIERYNLPREAVPTHWLNEVSVWDALLQRMPLTAMIRNLPKMTQVGLLQPFSEAAVLVRERLSDERTLKRSRIHPMAVLLAHQTYARGWSHRSSIVWTPVSHLVDALDEAFYASFENVTPNGKPLLLALDVSGSMSWYGVAGTSLTPRVAAAAMALVTAATEPNSEIVAFTASRNGFGGRFGGQSGLTPLDITPRMRLDDVLARVFQLPAGGTDCALPMTWARQEKVNVSGFVIYTDNETWAGDIHPAQALRQYRQETGTDAKSAVVAMVSNGFSIADPEDRGMVDIAGFDASVPTLVSEFLRES